MSITTGLSDERILAELGDRLARLRLNRNLTQAHLAEQAGVSKRTVERMEAGHSAQLASLIRVLRALGEVEAFDRLLPEPQPSPLQQLKLKGRQRERASGRRELKDSPKGPWTWGDDS